VLAACADTNTNFGGFIAIQNLLTSRGRPPAIISIRDLESESHLGSSFNLEAIGPASKGMIF
jgi:hypothetical protein